MSEQQDSQNTVELAAELTMAYLSNPNTRLNAEDIGQVLRQVHEAIQGISEAGQEPAAEPAQEFTPAVSVRKSTASKDHIISLIDGKPYKSLKRHLSRHGLTPEQYRERYGLRSDYPMVAESYAQHRRELAKKIGLGRKPGQKPAPKRGGRKAAAAPASDEG